jgi:hypothetical protein
VLIPNECKAGDVLEIILNKEETEKRRKYKPKICGNKNFEHLISEDGQLK